MRKYLFFYLFSMMCAVTLFTACSDDDDNNGNGNGEGEGTTDFVTTELVGNYKGTITAELVMEPENMPVGESSQNISVTKAGDNAISLSINNFSFLSGAVTISEISLENCELTKNGNVYDFSGTTSVNEPDIQLTGTVNLVGTIGGGNVSLEMDIPDANFMGMDQHVAVTYVGTRLTGQENNEAAITSFTFDASTEANQVVNIQPVINEDTKVITFSVAEGTTDEQLKALVPTIVLSDGATLTTGVSGEATDFTKAQTYTVVSEDGTASATYTVNVPTKGSLTLKYSFEEWSGLESANNTLLPSEIWDSSASGAGLLGGTILIRDTVPGVEGYAARMTSYEYPGDGGKLIPKVTAGSIFLGSFDMMPALTGDRLSSTKFGIPCETLGMVGKPKTFKGYYKYTSGEKFINGQEDPTGNTIIEGRKDECFIQAVLYEAEDAEGNEVTLTGHDVNDSEYRVAIAQLADGTEKSEFTEFNIEFEYLKEYDPAKNYKFAIVCTSSKEGDLFNGAGKSTLVVDEFEVTCE